MVKEYKTVEVKNSTMYGFTVKRNDKPKPTHEDYQKFLRLLASRGDIIDFTYEEKTKNGNPTKLHIHGVVTFLRNPYFKQLCPKGFHTKFEELYDIDGWRRYTQKNLHDDPISAAKEIIDNTKYMF